MNDSKKSLVRGFTLLELLIVIAIIGILISVAAASYAQAQLKSRNARRMSDIKSIQDAAEQYYADNASTYPSAGTGLNGTYLPGNYPNGPKSDTYTYVPGPASCTTNCTTYCVCATLEPAGNTNGNSNAAANITCSGMGTAGQYYCTKNLQ